jgi:hypothetical protein
MNKIHIDDLQRHIDDYLTDIFPIVLAKVEALKTCLDQLKANQFTSKVRGFNLAKGVMISLLQWLSPTATFPDKSTFNAATFKSTLETFVLNNASTNFASTVNACANFTDKLLVNDQALLKEILISPANELRRLNIRLTRCLKVPKVRAFFNIAFTYDFASPEIVDFFRKKNIVAFCPYCNRKSAAYVMGADGKPAETPELDHFFSQVDHPLLCYSLFNLIPSDSNCNKTNKGETKFSDKYHLNPYIAGFGEDACFRVVFRKNRQHLDEEIKVDEIRVNVNAISGSKRRRQLVGKDSPEGHPHGNINIFRLRALYNTDDAKGVAQRLTMKLQTNSSNIFSLDEFLRKIEVNNNRENIYIKWFESEFLTSFYKQRFNSFLYAKLKRDLHDAYFLEDDPTNPNYDFIRKLIATD